MKQYFPIFFLLFFIMWSCSSSKQTTADLSPPIFKTGDEIHKDVFKKLDGIWKGAFIIYEDDNPVDAAEVDLSRITLKDIEALDLKEINRIEVRQKYTSVNPYFQKVEIEDKDLNSGAMIVSKGINKVENGKLVCVVQKPDEVIVHEGMVPEEGTIIWFSEQKKPLKKEYFVEKVDDEYYEIVGYGYYEGHDLDKTPQLYFYALYKKEK